MATHDLPDAARLFDPIASLPHGSEEEVAWVGNFLGSRTGLGPGRDGAGPGNGGLAGAYAGISA